MLIFHYFSGFSSEFVKSFKYGFPSNWLSLVSDHFNSQSRLVFFICFERGWEDTRDAGHLSLCMGIYDKVKVATSAIYEVTILEIKATIALPFQSSLSVMQWQQRNPQKSALQVQCFSLLRNLTVLKRVVILSLLVVLPCKKFSVCDNFA